MGKPAAARVTALPNTGAGLADSDGTGGTLALALGALLAGGGAAVARRRA